MPSLKIGTLTVICDVIMCSTHLLPISLPSIVALLDLADEHLQCSVLVIALSRSLPNLGELLHLFMYVGGTVVTKHPLQVNPAFVLVGFEI